MAHLPGGELIAEGIKDYTAGRITTAACLVAVGWPRLRRAGIGLHEITPHRISDPELQLYQLLGQEGGDAYSRYNSLIRQLVSFEQSLEHQNAKKRKTESGNRLC